jgi:hypothetical protein
MADGLGKERGRAIATLIAEVTKVFELIARREWLPWGAKILFVEYQAQLEVEERVEQARRQREEEEVERQRAVEEKVKRLED